MIGDLYLNSDKCSLIYLIIAFCLAYKNKNKKNHDRGITKYVTPAVRINQGKSDALSLFLT